MNASALILDFGGVISRTIFETHRDTEKSLGLAPNSLTWRGPFDPDSDRLWAAMQRDEISEREYYARRTAEVSEMLDAGWTEMSQFIRAARGADPAAIVRPEARSAISAAKRAGHKLAILSNELDLFYGAEFRSRLPLLAEFDVIYDATYTGILKPRARAYRDCLDQLAVPADRSVFVDDQMRNIRGAEAVGMHAIHFDVTRPAASFADALNNLDELKERDNAPP